MNQLTQYLVDQILLKEDESKYKEVIALYPGGYKIPTLAHFHIADEISKRPEISKVKVLIGHKERDGITKEQSLAIWNIYKKYLNNKVELQIASNISPVKDVLDIIKENPNNFYILVFGRDEDSSRFKSAEKYSNVKIINISDVGVAGISGTNARKEIASGNFEGLQKYLPIELTIEEREEIWNILTKKVNEIKGKYHDRLVKMAQRKDPDKLTDLGKTYLKEDKKLDDKTLSLIADKVMEKYPKINNGGCAQFAIIMSELFGFDKFYLEYYIEDKNRIAPQHIAINLGNNKAYDAEGIYPKDDLVDGYEYEDANLEDAEDFRKDIGDKYNQDELKEFIENLTSKHPLNENLESHAKEELDRAGLFDEDADYEGMIGKCVLELIQTMSKQGHSGFSASWVRDLFNKLSNYENLTPLVAEDFEDVSHYGSKEDKPLYQNTRNSAVFCTDPKDESTWYHVDGKTINEGIKIGLNNYKKLLTEEIKSSQNNSDFKQYITYIAKVVDICCRQLEISNPEVVLVNNENYTKENKSFGGYVPTENKIYLVIKNRNLADVCRTLSHELKHAEQNSKGRLNIGAGQDGDEFENEANSYSGEFMRKFGRENPEIFNITN